MYNYTTYSTFRISKTLNHLSMLSRACLATLCFRLAPTLGDAKRCNNYATRSCTFVFLGGARCPETLKNDHVERSGPRLESPLGVVNRPSYCFVTDDCIGSSSLISLVDNAIFETMKNTTF